MVQRRRRLHRAARNARHSPSTSCRSLSYQSSGLWRRASLLDGHVYRQEYRRGSDTDCQMQVFPFSVSDEFAVENACFSGGRRCRLSDASVLIQCFNSVFPMSLRWRMRVFRVETEQGEGIPVQDGRTQTRCHGYWYARYAVVSRRHETSVLIVQDRVCVQS